MTIFNALIIIIKDVRNQYQSLKMKNLCNITMSSYLKPGDWFTLVSEPGKSQTCRVYSRIDWTTFKFEYEWEYYNREFETVFFILIGVAAIMTAFILFL